MYKRKKKTKKLVAGAGITPRTNRDLKVQQRVCVCVSECVAKGLQAPRGPLTATPPTEEQGLVGSGWPLLLPLLVTPLLSSFLCGTGLDRQVLPVT